MGLEECANHKKDWTGQTMVRSKCAVILEAKTMEGHCKDVAEAQDDQSIGISVCCFRHAKYLLSHLPSRLLALKGECRRYDLSCEFCKLAINPSKLKTSSIRQNMPELSTPYRALITRHLPNPHPSCSGAVLKCQLAHAAAVHASQEQNLSTDFQNASKGSLFEKTLKHSETTSLSSCCRQSRWPFHLLPPGKLDSPGWSSCSGSSGCSTVPAQSGAKGPKSGEKAVLSLRWSPFSSIFGNVLHSKGNHLGLFQWHSKKKTMAQKPAPSRRQILSKKKLVGFSGFFEKLLDRLTRTACPRPDKTGPHLYVDILRAFVSRRWPCWAAGSAARAPAPDVGARGRPSPQVVCSSLHIIICCLRCFLRFLVVYIC